MIKAVFGQLAVPQAERYTAHGFRRVTSHGLKEPGSPWSVVASCGVWHSPAFRGYLDTSKDMELEALQMFGVYFYSDSAADE